MRGTLVVFLALLLTSCTTAPTDPPASPPALSDTSWQITQISGTEITEGLLTFTFSGDRFGAFFGCNWVSGEFAQDGSTLSFSQVASTLMGCVDPVGRYESEGIAALDEVRQLGGSQTAPELLAADGTVLFALRELPDETLEGTKWQLESVLSPQSTPAAGKVTIAISDGELQGKACNNFRGSLTVSGDQFDVGPLVSTRRACVDPALTTLESQVLRLLEAATRYTVHGEILTVLGPDGSGLTFTSIE